MAQETPVLQSLIEQFPLEQTGKIFQVTGISSPITGKFIRKFVTVTTMPLPAATPVMGTQSLYLNFIGLE